MDPVFFDSPGAFRAWLKEHHDTETEVLVGYYKKDAGRPSMTWPDSVDEALCFGWIDGVRRRLDDEAYCIRFTPRRPGSHWSKVNVAKAEALIAEGRMARAGLRAFAARSEERTGQASFERRYRLTAEMRARFAADKAAWAFWQDQPPGYRRTATGWVMQAKRQETRDRRLAKLIDCSARGERIPEVLPPSKRKAPAAKEAALPPDLESRLRTDPDAHAFFLAQTPGVRRRSIAYILAAKKEGTRLRRLDGMMEKARRGERWW